MIMQPAIEEQQRLSFRRAFLWPLVALVVVAAALVHLDWILYEFSVDTAALPPGSGIRPMGPALHMLLCSGLFRFGGRVLFVGRNRRRRRAASFVSGSCRIGNFGPLCCAVVRWLPGVQPDHRGAEAGYRAVDPMTYSVPCECGKTLAVIATDAGTDMRCECGRLVSVPILSQLRQQSGQGHTKPAQSTRSTG